MQGHLKHILRPSASAHARSAAAPLKLDTVCDSPTPGRLTISEENCDDRVARSLGSQCEHPAADPPKPARLRLAVMS